MPEFRTWPVHPRRLPDELLSSWLMRISQAYGLKLYTFTHRAFPNYSIWNRDIDKTAPEGLLTILSQCTGRPYEEVYQSTLKSYEGYLFENMVPGNTRWILPVGIYHRTHKRKGLAACPVCLAEDTTPYFRRLWRIGFTVVCTKHSVWMIDECPICKQPIVFHRNDFEHKYTPTEKGMNLCYFCGFDYSNTELKFESDQLFIKFLSILEESLNNGYIKLDDRIIYSHLYFDVLYQLLKLISIDKYGIKLRHVLEVESDLTYNHQNSKVNYVDALPISERRHAFRLISYLMDDWPQSFIVACKKAKLTKSRLEKDMKAVPFWYSQILRNNLDETSYGPSFDEIRTAHKYLQLSGKGVTRRSLLKVMGYKDSKLISNYLKINKIT